MFKIMRKDDCIWVRDERGNQEEVPEEIHMTPDQARMIARLLDRACEAGSTTDFTETIPAEA